MDYKIQKITQWLDSGSINLFGMPFSGKDTQGEILSKMFNGPLIGGGDILRSHEDPAAIEKVLASGGIVPSDFYLHMVLPYLSREELQGRPLILSAVGRSSGEENPILEATEQSGHPIKAVIYLKLNDDEVWRRFEASQQNGGRGDRSDDTRESLATRLQKFNDRTVPVIEHYRRLGLLIEIDGSQPKDQVTLQIIESLLQKYQV